MSRTLQYVRERRENEKIPDQDEIEKKREERLVQMPSCGASGDAASACTYHRQVGEQKRCAASMFMKVQCPYLGKVLPHPEKVEEVKREQKRLDVRYEPPPED